jgi:hypothetical protein
LITAASARSNQQSIYNNRVLTKSPKFKKGPMKPILSPFLFLLKADLPNFVAIYQVMRSG